MGSTKPKLRQSILISVVGILVLAFAGCTKQEKPNKSTLTLPPSPKLTQDGGDDIFQPYGTEAVKNLLHYLNEGTSADLPFTFTIVSLSADESSFVSLVAVALMSDVAAAQARLKKLGSRNGMNLCNALITSPDPSGYYNRKKLLELEEHGGSFGCDGTMDSREAAYQITSEFITQHQTANAPDPDGLVIFGRRDVLVYVAESNRAAFRLSDKKVSKDLFPPRTTGRAFQVCNLIVQWKSSLGVAYARYLARMKKVALESKHVCPQATEAPPKGTVSFATPDDARYFPELLPAMKKAGIKYQLFENKYWVAKSDLKRAESILIGQVKNYRQEGPP